ncbi:MAG: acyl-ACP--UDP-N-acetylglucosamine O-acyltransferase [Bacteroidia bacterium]|nr:acyl-ACP--UDP-N-acetylglucosamine O-acyltransferase [Bacteroidia bacterium]
MRSKFSEVHPNARIHDNVFISPFTFIAEDVEIGEGSWIAPNVTILDGARIGKNVKIHSGAVISGDPQDLKYKGEKTTAEIGDNSVIRECVTFNKGTSDRNKTSLGKNCLLMAYVHLAHDCIVGDNCILANSVGLAGHITIEDFAILEGSVVVQQFVTIGAHSFIAGTTPVRKNVPPFVKAAREPIQYVGVNSIGLSRRGFSKESVQQIEDIYRIIFVKGFNMTKALEMIENEIPASAEKNQILNFIRNSKDGVIKGI